MLKITTMAIAALAVAGGTLAMPIDAEARQRSRSVSVQGAHGHGYDRHRSVTREPGYRSVSRGVQTNSGRGVSSSRQAGWGNGSYSGGAIHTTNNGTTWSRDTVVTNNGDGSYTGTLSRTYADGSTSSRTKTFARD